MLITSSSLGSIFQRTGEKSHHIMSIKSGLYKIISVKENGPLTYSPPTDSLAVKGEPGTTFYFSRVKDSDVYTIQTLKEYTYAHINVEPPGYPLVNADSQESYLWQITPVEGDPEKYNVIVYIGPYKDRAWLTNRLGSPTPLVMVAPFQEGDPYQQFTFRHVDA